MEKIYKVAIIGGGASGLTAAIMLGEKLGENVVVLERLNRVGKKITVTGNGRGNITNAVVRAENYHSKEGNAAAFVSSALNSFGKEGTLDFFRKLGLITAEENGKIYPASFQASSVLDLMRFKVQAVGCEVKTEFFVSQIKKGEVFTVISDKGEKIKAENVIFAVGGKCQKQLGTDGSGYEIAKTLGHTVTECLPSLVQLKTDVSDIKTLKGVRQEVELSLICGNKKIKTCAGDVIFTEFGISGNAVFQLSSAAISQENPAVSISFLNEYSKEDLVALLKEKIITAPHLTAEDLLTGYVNKQVGRVVLRRAGVNSAEKCPISRVNAVVDCLKDFRLPVFGTLGFNYAQVTRGGVRTDEIDRHTMQSLKCKKLYLTGEVVDVDGDCGGFNLQWAFSSAYLAAKNILKEIEQ